MILKPAQKYDFFPFLQKQTDLKRFLNLIGNLHQAIESQRRLLQPPVRLVDPRFFPATFSHRETQDSGKQGSGL
jgi:hypothetical protein